MENTNEKAQAIWRGVSIANSSYNGPIKDFRETFNPAGYRLAILLQNLTSANKDDREKAKKDVRELVKIGKEM